MKQKEIKIGNKRKEKLKLIIKYLKVIWKIIFSKENEEENKLYKPSFAERIRGKQKRLAFKTYRINFDLYILNKKIEVKNIVVPAYTKKEAEVKAAQLLYAQMRPVVVNIQSFKPSPPTDPEKQI